MNKQKGQFFSIDFLIAMSIAVLALGMLLHFYEINTYEQQDAKIQNELTLIAMNSSNILLNTNKCSGASGLITKGYELQGCTNTTSWSGLTKAKLMIPTGFNCYITKGGVVAVTACNDTILTTESNIAVIERIFLERTPQTTLSQYENCLDGSCTGIYTTRELVVKIWK